MDRGPFSVASLLCAHNDRKRNHEQMSSSSDSIYDPRRASASVSATDGSAVSSSSRNGIQIPSFRMNARDGYDLRRPIMSTSIPTSPPQPLPNNDASRDIIDLTETPDTLVTDFILPPEQYPDHLARRPYRRTPPRRIPPRRVQREDVIDLSEDVVDADTTTNRQDSPEIQFLSSRTRSRSRDARSNENRPRDEWHGNDSTSQAPRMNLPQFLANAQLPGFLTNRQLPGLERLQRYASRFGTGSTTAARARDELTAFESFQGFRGWVLPNNLDVEAIGFDYEHPARHHHPPPRLPTYTAPSSPRPGFTRSPREMDVLICPYCDEELATGSSDLQKQVWVVKACGHVYCGGCNQKRTVSRRAAAKKSGKPLDKSSPFSKCVVDGCGKSVAAPRSMIQVYL